MNATPIDPADIRAGDLIRWQDGDEVEEWRSRFDFPPHKAWGQHYLIERPRVVIEMLPEDIARLDRDAL